MPISKHEVLVKPLTVFAKMDGADVFFSDHIPSGCSSFPA